jgi:hypothetical protein
MDTQTALVAQLQTPSSSIKTMTLVGVGSAILIFSITALVAMVSPAIVGLLIPHASAVVASIAGMISVFSGATAAVNYKTTAALSPAIPTAK